MEGVNRKNFITTQYAKLAIGKSTRVMPFITCSTAKFTEVSDNHGVIWALLTSAAGIQRLQEYNGGSRFNTTHKTVIDIQDR